MTDFPWPDLVAGLVTLFFLMAGVELGVSLLRRGSNAASGGSDAE